MSWLSVLGCAWSVPSVAFVTQSPLSAGCDVYTPPAVQRPPGRPSPRDVPGPRTWLCPSLPRRPVDSELPRAGHLVYRCAAVVRWGRRRGSAARGRWLCRVRCHRVPRGVYPEAAPAGSAGHTRVCRLCLPQMRAPLIGPCARVRGWCAGRGQLLRQLRQRPRLTRAEPISAEQGAGRPHHQPAASARNRRRRRVVGLPCTAGAQLFLRRGPRAAGRRLSVDGARRRRRRRRRVGPAESQCC